MTYDPDFRRTSLRIFMAANKLKVAPWCRSAGLSEGTLRNFLNGASESLSDRSYEALAEAAGTNTEDMKTAAIGAIHNPEVRPPLSIAIRSARIARGLSQEDLGAMVGVSRQAVNMWESGTNFPTVARLTAVAEALGDPRIANIAGSVSDDRALLAVRAMVDAGASKAVLLAFIDEQLAACSPADAVSQGASRKPSEPRSPARESEAVTAQSGTVDTARDPAGTIDP